MEIKGGEKFKAVLEDIARQLGKGESLKVGFLEGATEPDGTPVAAAAFFNEYGTRSIPPRPFMRTTINEHAASWPKALAGLIKGANYDAEVALTQFAEGVRSQIVTAIHDVHAPPLSPITLMLRKMRSEGGANFRVTGAIVGEAAARVAAGEDYSGQSEKPLEETHTLVNSVDYEVNA